MSASGSFGLLMVIVSGPKDMRLYSAKSTANSFSSFPDKIRYETVVSCAYTRLKEQRHVKTRDFLVIII